MFRLTDHVIDRMLEAGIAPEQFRRALSGSPERRGEYATFRGCGWSLMAVMDRIDDCEWLVLDLFRTYAESGRSAA